MNKTFKKINITYIITFSFRLLGLFVLLGDILISFVVSVFVFVKVLIINISKSIKKISLNKVIMFAKNNAKNLKRWKSHNKNVTKLRSKQKAARAKKSAAAKTFQKNKNLQNLINFVTFSKKAEKLEKQANSLKSSKKIKKGKKVKNQQKPAVYSKYSKKLKKNKKGQLEYKKQKRFGLRPKFTFAFVFILGIIFSFAFIFVPMQVNAWYKELPSPDNLYENQNKSTKILDREGRLLYEIYIDKNYDPIELEQIPDYAIAATILLEDDEFFNHQGFRPLSIVRAAKATLFDENLQGGSTITQQLVKNVLLTPERTISRKVKEIVLAYRVEQIYTKAEILELYFNNISYGGTAWGIQSAAEKFFNKDAKDLTLQEATILAVLPAAPTNYSPFTGNFDLTRRQQKHLLNKMVATNVITQVEADEAYDTPIQFAEQIDYIRAPHFVEYVRQQLNEKYGKRMVDHGGLTVKTTLDLELQDKAQKIVSGVVAENAELQISNGGAVILQPISGDILAYVGSIDYFNEKNDGTYDVVTAYRSPGSTIKALTYALAFENKMTPATYINDSPLTVKTTTETYSPVNYDGKFHGNVTLRNALANSYNIPPVRLAQKFGPDNIVRLGYNMGLKDWQVGSGYGLSVTLGGKETRLLDLTNTYATLARGGVYTPTNPFLEIKDKNGNDIYFKEISQERALSAGSSYILTSILSDNRARLPAFGTNNNLEIEGHKVAVKTGTSDDKRDNLTVGYTPDYAVGVWVGNNDNSPMHPRLASGLSGAAPIWNQIMTVILEDVEAKEFSVPTDIVIKEYPECGANVSEVFIEGTELGTLCKKVEKESDDKDDEKDERAERRERRRRDRD